MPDPLPLSRFPDDKKLKMVRCQICDPAEVWCTNREALASHHRLEHTPPELLVTAGMIIDCPKSECSKWFTRACTDDLRSHVIDRHPHSASRLCYDILDDHERDACGRKLADVVRILDEWLSTNAPVVDPPQASKSRRGRNESKLQEVFDSTLPVPYICTKCHPFVSHTRWADKIHHDRAKHVSEDDLRRCGMLVACPVGHCRREYSRERPDHLRTHLASKRGREREGHDMDKKTCDRLILSRNQRDTEGRTLSDVKCEVDKILIEKWAAEGYDKKGRKL